MTSPDDRPLESHVKPVYVVGIDGSAASAAALRWATSRPDVGQVRAVYVFHTSNLVPPARAAHLLPALGWQRQAAQDQAESYVQQALSGRTAAPVVVTAVEGEPRHTLIERSRDADVLVLGASHRTAFGTRVLGSTSSACAAHAACPVMVVPEAWSPRPLVPAAAGT